MNAFRYVPTIFLMVLMCTPLPAYSDQQRQFILIDKTAETAPVRNEPNGTSSLGRVKAGSKVEVFEKKAVRNGAYMATWYRINFNGKTGWISQYVTTGDIITENVEAKKQTNQRAAGADKLRKAPFDEEAKENFKKWLKEKTAVTGVEFRNDGDMLVNLEPTKYITSDLEDLALSIAKQYRSSTNYNKQINVKILNINNSIVLAEASLP